LSEDPEAAVAAGALGALLRERRTHRYRTWLETRHLYPKEWQQAAAGGDFVVYLTPAELEALSSELVNTIVGWFHERLEDPSKRPPGAAPVEVLMITYPITPPAAG
jgi:hypothetical protein